jgi:hypothetical protein
MSPEQPYLSVVVTARNDDHGGNLLGRMQAFAGGFIEQAKRHNLSSELIFVEWNPPAERPPLREVLQWPVDFGPCQVRFIEVPLAVHSRYQHAEVLPLYQMMAKNVGIRRARGEFILATNIDILFSEELVAFLAERRLTEGKMYRMDRHDAMPELPEGSVEDHLEYCRTHLIRVNAREGTFQVKPDGTPSLAPADIAAPDAGLIPGEGWCAVERYDDTDVFRWIEHEAVLHISPPPDGGSVLAFEVEPGPGRVAEKIEIEFVDRAGEIVAQAAVNSRCHVLVEFAPAVLAEGRIRIRIHGGGGQIAQDLRMLNLRVFRIEWTTARLSGARVQPATSRSPQPPRHPQTSRGEVVELSPLRKLQLKRRTINRLFRRLVESGTIASLTFFVSPRLKAVAAAFLETQRITYKAEVPEPAELEAPEEAEPEPANETRASAASEEHLRRSRGFPISKRRFLHTNGCGDFTLMARSHWLDLRGYPEFDLFSMNIDSVLCYTAHYGGADEEMLTDPMRIYHLEHGTGSGWTPEGQAKLFARVAAKGMKFVSHADIVGWAGQIRQLQSPMIFNHADWGLSAFNFEETSSPF